MMNRVEVTTTSGATLALPLRDSSDGYLIKDIEGLDPVKATIVTSNFAQLDGTTFQSSRRESRNILFKLGLKPNYATGSVEALKSRLTSFFRIGTMVRLRFYMESGLTVDIQGMVESNNCPLFAKEPEATISVMCFLPDFYVPEPVLATGNTDWVPEPNIIQYDGDIETGFIFRMTANRTLSDFTIEHRPEDGTLRVLHFNKNLSAHEELEISTIARAKGAWLIEGGVNRESVLYGITTWSDWLNLFPGKNDIRVYAEGTPIPYTIQYTNKYGGL